MSTALVIPAAGSGARLGASDPKAFVMLAGRPLLWHAIRRAACSGAVDEIVIAAPAGLVRDAERIAAEAATGLAGCTGATMVDGDMASPAAEVLAASGPGVEGRQSANAATELTPPPGPDGGGRPSTSSWAARITVVAGGGDRSASVDAALAVMKDAGSVLVHDAARCLTPPEVFVRVAGALAEDASAVVPVLPVTDTIRTVAGDSPGVARAEGADDAALAEATGGVGARADGEPRPGAEPRTGRYERLTGGLDRAALRRIQTPQGFARDVLVRAHELQRRDPDPAATDDAALVERIGSEVVAVDGDEAALKITYPIDLRIARLYLEEDDFE